MRIDAADALESKFYLKNCYDPWLRVYNRGWITLVNKKKNAFGGKLIDIVLRSLTERKTNMERNEIDKCKKRN